MYKPEEDADEIVPGVWISRWQPALNEDWLKKHKITAVFNCTKQVTFHPSVPYQYRIPVDDNLQPAEIQHMEDWAAEIAYKILREFKAGHPLLIHCHAGMQRSTTACAFFLMALTGRPLIEIMQLIKDRRPIAFEPSPNFATPLRTFEAEIRQLHRQR